MASSASLMCRRQTTSGNPRSFMINDILQSQVQNIENENKKELHNFRSMYPLFATHRVSPEYSPETLSPMNSLGPGFFGASRHGGTDIPPHHSRLNPYMKFGLNFIPPHAGYFLTRAAELMTGNCVLPSLPLPITLQPYDHLPLYLRDRLLHFAEAGMGSRKCRRSRTVFSEVQLMALEERFERQKYLSTPDRMELAEGLGLTQLQVKTWYQNRRMKWKKQVQQIDESNHSSSDSLEISQHSSSMSDSRDSKPVHEGKMSPGQLKEVDRQKLQNSEYNNGRTSSSSQTLSHARSIKAADYFPRFPRSPIFSRSQGGGPFDLSIRSSNHHQSMKYKENE